MKIAASTAMLCWCNTKLIIVIKKPAIATTPAANPSRPSSKFTVFIMPAVQNQVRRMAGMAARLMLGCMSGEAGWMKRNKVGCKYHGKPGCIISLPKGLLKVNRSIP